MVEVMQVAVVFMTAMSIFMIGNGFSNENREQFFIGFLMLLVSLGFLLSTFFGVQFFTLPTIF
jgi:hypothetical protein